MRIGSATPAQQSASEQHSCVWLPRTFQMHANKWVMAQKANVTDNLCGNQISGAPHAMLISTQPAIPFI